MAPRYGSMAYKGIILVTLVALAAAFLVIRPVGAQDASIDYAENGTDPVATYTGLDPEGRPVYWSLLDDATDIDNVAATDIVDEGAFSISDGVLSFKLPPDFEVPNSSIAENVYKIVVVASDDALGVTGRKDAYHKVTVTVTDVDEDGSISLSAQQPQVGVELTATLTDQDSRSTGRPIANETWKWEQSSAMSGPWSLISGAGAGDTDSAAAVKASDRYTPVADTVGQYLRVTATYTDEHGDDKTAMAVSAHTVRKAPPNNAAPAFASGVIRSIDENSPPGTNVGKPVTAGDAGDVLTYTLEEGGEKSLYSINRATGQITVGSRTMLDREVLTDPFQHTVTVRATDPFGDPNAVTAVDENSGSVAVNITIKNVNEAPTMTAGATKVSHAENTVIADMVSTYMATDQESTASEGQCTSTSDGSTCAWSLSGADMGDFSISNAGELTFKEIPNFESPADSNGDNVYMVTVIATDSTKPKLTATRDVVITISNADDDGVITFSSVRPRVRIPFTATLTDEDGVVAESVKWRWYNADPDSNGDGILDSDAAIAKATSATYTPKPTDVTDAPTTLYVWATYTDNFGSTSSTGASDSTVEANQANQAPRFEDATGNVITSTTRDIPENTLAVSDDDVSDDGRDNVGTPVKATDANATDANATEIDNTEILTYTLGGPDADKFRLRQGTEGGQIEVGAGTKLDYEKKKSYMVTVTATDPSQDSATIDVTINIMPVNEVPDITQEDNLTKEFRENGTGTIQTFSATDPEKRPVYWSLALSEGGVYPVEGALTINGKSGALSFKSPPDYENAPSGITNNSYPVRVVASDDASNLGDAAHTEAALLSFRTFTVKVTNVVEQESITVSPKFAQEGQALTVSLTGGDATEADRNEANWKWSGVVEGTANDVADAPIPAPSDTGIITVEVTYPALSKDRTKTTTISVRAAPEGNVDPTFTNPDAARSVDEGKPAGTLVGTFVASDTNPEHRNRLTYAVDPTSQVNFSITTTGQLKTRMPLEYATATQHSVTVTATDPTGGTGEIEVTVAVKDVNEAPTITGPTRALPKLENIATTIVVAVYTATDPDGDDLVWKLTGTDASDFNIGNQDDATPGTLTFKEMPDYEKPAASNNLYRVTVEVSDGKNKGTRPMTVMVNDQEEVGEVKLSTVAPKVAVELTASLEDSDGGVKDVTWKWERDGTTDAADNADTEMTIEGATSATYTPTTADIGMYLRATASYTDRRGTGKTAMRTSANVVIANKDFRAPSFKETDTTREVREDAKPNSALENTQGNVGAKVTATDPNGGDLLTYKLTGMDAGLFKVSNDEADDPIVRGGQIHLNTGTKLDYEAKNSYMVTVTATDPNGLSDSIDVTIMVTDMDEVPEIIVGGLVITGLRAVSYAENGTGNVTPYMAAGRDAASATWSLSGADMGDFMISNTGVLTFRSSPDFETPADADMMNDYEVTVEANDGTNTAMKAVTINVTNVNEDGTVSLSTQQPRVGTAITATLTDADGVVTGTTWQWAKAGTAAGSFDDISGATNASYTPVAADIGMYLRATASYTDGYGPGKSAMKVSSSNVTDVDEVATLKDRYDANDNGKIDRDEVLNAIDDFFDPDVSITREQVLDLIDLFFEGLGS